MKIVKEQLKEMIKEELESLFNNEDYDDNEEEPKQPIDPEAVKRAMESSADEYTNLVQNYSQGTEKILNDLGDSFNFQHSGPELKAYKEANIKFNHLVEMIQREGYKIVDEFNNIMWNLKIKQ